MAEKINTVAGSIIPSELGRTLIHEHLVCGYSGWECDALARPYNPEKIRAICVKAVSPVKQYGIKSIVDATTIDLSRDVEILKAVSGQLEINIICSTGMYTEEAGKWAYLKQRSHRKIGDMATELYDTYMRELTVGIGSTGVKAGIIKVATGLGRISECETASLRAAARAQKETGVPVITHTEDGTMGPGQLDILIGEGADHSRIMCGHMCGNSSIQYQLDVLSRGTFIGLDRFGVEWIMPDDVRKALLISLISLGYTDRIMISHDYVACGFGRGGALPQDKKKTAVNWNYANIFSNILPAVKKAGVSDSQIDIMMVDNPRRLFGC